jgi:hypothetical protein
MRPSRNQFQCLPKGGVLTHWDVHAPPPPHFPSDCHYFGKVLAQVDQNPEISGLTFLMTWDIDTIPRAGEDIVVLLIGDERYQLPAYAADVRAVFKTGGGRQFIPRGFRGCRVQFTALESLRVLRNQCLLLTRSFRKKLERRGWARVFPVPLGYYCPECPPFKPMREREFDLFYAGGVNQSLQGWGKLRATRPKDFARASLLEALDDLRRLEPGIRICAPERRLDFGEYARAMMNSRISLCPRGNFIETFRLCEAARFGSVIVSEPLPPLWYYKGISAIQTSRWDLLPRTIAGLWRDAAKLESLSAATLDWWNHGPGEASVASYIVSKLQIPNLHPAGGMAAVC